MEAFFKTRYFFQTFFFIDCLIGLFVTPVSVFIQQILIGQWLVTLIVDWSLLIALNVDWLTSNCDNW